MPRRKDRRLMAVKNALLALLSDGARYGYQLKAEFDRATGAGWPLNIGQVYSTLQRLERDEHIKPDGKPDDEGRQSYLLTAQGQELIDEWLDTPINNPTTSRDEVSMKVLIAVATNVAPALDVVRTQHMWAMGQLQALTAQKAQNARSDLATRLHLDRTILLAEAEIRWLNLVEQRLESEGQQHTSQVPHARQSTDHVPNRKASKQKDTNQ